MRSRGTPPDLGQLGRFGDDCGLVALAGDCHRVELGQLVKDGGELAPVPAHLVGYSVNHVRALRVDDGLACLSRAVLAHPCWRLEAGYHRCAVAAGSDEHALNHGTEL